MAHQVAKVLRWQRSSGHAASERAGVKRPALAAAAVEVSPVSRYAITFGETAVLHIGGEEVGARRSSGFTVPELHLLAEKLTKEGVETAPAERKVKAHSDEFVDLSEALPKKLRKDNEAATLVIRNGASVLLRDEDAAACLLREQEDLSYDSQYWDARRGRTLTKRARHNLVFGEEAATPSKDFKQYSVKAFRDLPHLAKFRAALAERLGEKAQGLFAEGNHYFETSSGIGFHGDSERKIVICLSLGASSTLRYCWRMPGSSENVGQVDIAVHHGDVYVMSEKATGFDWRCRSKVRVVHAAGAEKYIGS
ncbi:unnamed protein product [Symbiodinium microadriaticum]|nr:unnamed protein product [Symbiodinium microadriaticum]